MAYISSKIRGYGKINPAKVKAGYFTGIDASVSGDSAPLTAAEGVSYYNDSGDGISLGAPGLMNMIRTEIGQVGKRPGVKVEGRLNFSGRDLTPIYAAACEAGTVICGRTVNELGAGELEICVIRDGEQQFFKMGDYRLSCGYIMNNTLYGFIGGDSGQGAEHGFLMFDIAGATPKIYGNRGVITEASGVPRLTIEGFSDIYIPRISAGGELDSGGGTAMECINLINPFVTECFTVKAVDFATAGVHGCELSLPRLLNSDSRLEVHVFEQGVAVWKEINHVCTQAGRADRVNLVINSGEELIENGEDNIRLTYCRAAQDVDSGFKRICECSLAVTFGIAGYKDRLFITGNKGYANHIFYTAMDMYTYFGDLFYITLGDSNTEIAGISGQNSSLAAFTNDQVYYISGTTGSLVSGEYILPADFIISGMSKAAPAIVGMAPVVFDNEILYMSSRGVSALTASGVMDERYTQVRSALAGRWLLSEDLKSCIMAVYEEFLFVSNGRGRVYIFDGKQIAAAQNEPFSYRQFACYIWDDVPIYRMWTQNGRLFFLKNGEKYLFSIGLTDHVHLDDEYVEDDCIVKRAVNAYWETPYINGSDFYGDKSFSRISLLLEGLRSGGYETDTGARIRVKVNDGDWELLCDYNADQRLMRYDRLVYGVFTYSGRVLSYMINKRLRYKDVKRLKLRFENDMEGQSFIMQKLGVEY